ncbi:MAG: secretin N-terminal domain-containing protein [Thiobacillus sp.]
MTLSLSGCANKHLTEGRELIAGGQAEAGVARLREGLAQEPGNPELKAYYHSQRERTASTLLIEAQQALDSGKFDAAEMLLQRVLTLHPENPRARALLSNLDISLKHYHLVELARRALADKKPALATEKARQVLAQLPTHAGALDIMRQVQAATVQAEVTPLVLNATASKTVTLEFRDAPLRNIFDMISRQSGINFVFDKDVKLDTKATLFARNTQIGEAIDMLLLSGQLSKKIMNPNTVLVYPDQVAKQKQYRELMVKSFYLGNADAKNTMAMLRTLVKAKDMYVDDRLNLLVIRDTPEVIRLAEKLVAVQDLAEPEVMLDVEVLEIKRGRLLDLGVQYPNQFSLLFVPPATTATETPGGNTIVTTPSSASTALTLQSLKNIKSNQIAISPTPMVNVRKEDSDVNILANPRIRVKNREKAKIHIGDKVPVITSNTTSTGVISESVSYLDVGLKLDVEPNVMQREDVQIRVGLEVSNIVREIRSSSGTLTYQIGTRNAGTVLRLKDGETQVLAGLISDEERSAASRVPGLGDLPVLGRLFSNQRDERSKTEIVLLITPRVLRNTHAQQPALTEFRSGTENTISGNSGGQSSTVPWSPPEFPGGLGIDLPGQENPADGIPEIPPLPATTPGGEGGNSIFNTNDRLSDQEAKKVVPNSPLYSPTTHIPTPDSPVFSPSQ